MGRELLSNALLHDLRGNLTALLGWHSLLTEREGSAYGGLERSISALESTVALYSGLSPAMLVEGGVLVSALAERVDVLHSGEDVRVEVDGNRFEAACALAGVTEMVVRDVQQDTVWLDLHGCPGAGLRLLQSPHSVALVEAFDAKTPVLGVCLFKEVVRGVRGEYVCKEDAGILSLGLPRGKSD